MPDTRYTLVRDDETFVLDVEYEVAPYDPGVSWGPPEDCYPPEGGEITDLDIYHGDERFEVTDKEREAIEQHIYETHDYSDYASYEEDTWSSD